MPIDPMRIDTMTVSTTTGLTPCRHAPRRGFRIANPPCRSVFTRGFSDLFLHPDTL
jgi:hypothetical protein